MANAPFDISHLHSSEQMRIQAGDLSREERRKLMQGENPWPKAQPEEQANNETMDSSIPTRLMNQATEAKTQEPKNFSASDARSDKPLLNKRYRIIQSLGTSEFAETFLAEDILVPSNRRCIVKQLAVRSREPEIYQLMRERFDREAFNLERLGNDIEQIPALLAHFSENGHFYLVQEYVSGDTVAARVAKDGKFSETDVKEILRSLLSVLKIVHARNVIHRDVKPQNIVLRENDGKPFLIDLGAIKEITQTVVDTFGNPSTSIAIGTRGYMPLEQAAGRPVFASDLFALGLTAIFMLTGKQPGELHDPDTGEISWRIHASNISPAFAAVIDKATNSELRGRYHGAEQMLHALDEMPSQDGLSEDERAAEAGSTDRIETHNRGSVDGYLDPVLELMHFDFDRVGKDNKGQYVRVGKDFTGTVYKAGILDFRLKPERKGVPWVEARAEILFKGKNDQKLRVGAGVWHGRDQAKVPMRPGETQSLILTGGHSPDEPLSTYEHGPRGEENERIERILEGDTIWVRVGIVAEYMSTPTLETAWYFALSIVGGIPTIQLITREDFGGQH